MEPGEAGSPQSHQNFEELWIMLTDGGEVQVGEVVSHPKALEEIFIPRGTKHRRPKKCRIWTLKHDRFGPDLRFYCPIAWQRLNEDD